MSSSRLSSSCPSLPDLAINGTGAGNNFWPNQMYGLNMDRRKSWTAIEDLTECTKNSNKRCVCGRGFPVKDPIRSLARVIIRHRPLFSRIGLPVFLTSATLSLSPLTRTAALVCPVWTARSRYGPQNDCTIGKVGIVPVEYPRTR